MHVHKLDKFLLSYAPDSVGSEMAENAFLMFRYIYVRPTLKSRFYVHLSSITSAAALKIVLSDCTTSENLSSEGGDCLNPLSPVPTPPQKQKFFNLLLRVLWARLAAL